MILLFQEIQQELVTLSEQKQALETALQEAQTGLREKTETVQQLIVLKEQYTEINRIKVTLEEEINILRINYQQVRESIYTLKY